MDVTVHALNGEEYFIEVPVDVTGATVKELVSIQIGVPSFMFHMVWRDQMMLDSEPHCISQEDPNVTIAAKESSLDEFKLGDDHFLPSGFVNYATTDQGASVIESSGPVDDILQMGQQVLFENTAGNAPFVTIDLGGRRALSYVGALIYAPRSDLDPPSSQVRAIHVSGYQMSHVGHAGTWSLLASVDEHGLTHTPTNQSDVSRWVARLEDMPSVRYLKYSFGAHAGHGARVYGVIAWGHAQVVHTPETKPSCYPVGCCTRDALVKLVSLVRRKLSR